MSRTITVVSCVALAAGAAVSQVALLPIGKAVTKGQFTFVGKVALCDAVLAGMSYPPIVLYSMEFTDLEMIKGDKPDKMVLNYRTSVQGNKALVVDARVVVQATDGTITSISLATDEAIRAAGGTPASGATSQPASGPASRATSGPTSGPAAGAAWIKLFADEAWYKQQEGKEQVFGGKLEAVPQSGDAGILMRTSYYKLGSRTIYTGARKVKALDNLVGKKVDIRGKEVLMNLEGQALDEIWPAAVRAAE
jgi:hypothetical protein